MTGECDAGQGSVKVEEGVSARCVGSSEEGCGGATLSRVELFTLTGDEDNKDHDTGIYVTVKTGDEQSLLASVSNADSSGKDMTTYNDDSHHIVPLVVEAPGALKSDCRGFKVWMWIKTNGNDNWSVDDARVTLYFSDGTTLVAEQLGFSLDGDGAATEFASV
ncbi:hypothetical protein VSR01_05570 [Actinacidiphila sp. DG2A-62]|uniref:hypothetical protein n=1 Tax=Actinacidiphila sp. DG2A-62 TaxID=3108821 RepID=UPI002DB67075|nr:hypothetical protein [Actinacidiphila sp. DG2A-62]MEC3993036.1 hypothetical protein [Actinacidiphila sp. DG2A-62]